MIKSMAEAVFGSLLGIQAIDIVGYNMSQTDIEAFGFDQPNMSIDFEYMLSAEVEPQNYRVAILEKDGVFYATCNDRGIIYQINQPDILSVEFEKFPVRWFFSPLLFDLDELEIITGDEAYLFKITGSTNADLAVTCNGEAFDLERFRRLYKLVTSAAHDNDMREEVDVKGSPSVTINYRYRSLEKETDTLKLYPAGSRRMYAEANGLVEFTVKEQFVTRLTEALDVLFTDESFEIEW